MQSQESARARRGGGWASRRATRRMLRAALLFCLVAPGASAGPADGLPTGEAVLDRYVEVTGGKEAYGHLTSRVAKGTVDLGEVGIGAVFTETQLRPARLHSVIEADALGALEEGTNGTVAWASSLMMGPRVKRGPERAYLLRQAPLDAPAQWRGQFRGAVCVGREIVDGQSCCKLELTPHEGRPETRYYDEQSGLLVKTELVLDTELGPVQSVIFVNDYRNVDGVLLPHRRKTIQGKRGEMFVTFESIKHNLDVPPDLFEPPLEVQALLAKESDGRFQPSHATATSSNEPRS